MKVWDTFPVVDAGFEMRKMRTAVSCDLRRRVGEREKGGGVIS